MRHNRKILITGANGFVGKHLVKSLSAKRKHLVLIGRKECDKIPYEIQQNKFVEYIQYDLMSPPRDDILDTLNRIDTVVHLAVVTPDRTNPHDDLSLVPQNIMLTVNLINVLKNIGPIKTFILGSTIDVYPSLTSPLDENVLPEPVGNYAASRLACEFICTAGLEAINHKRPIILRFSQIYGSGDTHLKVIPQFVYNALSGKPLVVYGDGSDIRSFLYIDDAVRAIELAMKSCAEGVFNIAGDTPCSIKNVVDIISRFSPKPVSIQFMPRKKPQTSSIVSIKRAQEVLNFHPQFSLEKGIRKMIEDEQAIHAI